MLRLIPPGLHRLALPIAFTLRHYWRRIAKPRLTGVSVIAVNNAGEVLLVRHSYGPAYWSLPGGGCRSTEEPANAARREVQEELAVGLMGTTEFLQVEDRISGAPHTMHVFSGELVGEPRPDQREILEARFFSPDALPEKVGPIADGILKIWTRSQQG